MMTACDVSFFMNDLPNWFYGEGMLQILTSGHAKSHEGYQHVYLILKCIEFKYMITPPSSQSSYFQIL